MSYEVHQDVDEVSVIVRARYMRNDWMASAAQRWQRKIASVANRLFAATSQPQAVPVRSRSSWQKG